jgi:hypothetical protein
MWIFICNAGFFSVVLSGEADHLVIRARVRDDLVRLRQFYLPGIKIIATATRDYAWRSYVSKQAWSEALTRAALTIDAENFKAQTAEALGANRAALYSDIWLTLLGLHRG